MASFWVNEVRYFLYFVYLKLDLFDSPLAPGTDKLPAASLAA